MGKRLLLSIALIAHSLRRNRFDEILRYLHLADNAEIDTTDRFYKVRPIFDHLNDAFKQFSVEGNVVYIKAL